MKKLAVIFLVLILGLVAQSSPALESLVLGGVRDGLALGLVGEENLSRDLKFRFGAELNTGVNPVLLFLGGKFYLTAINDLIPLSLGLGLVGYFGNKSSGGGSISFIFDRVFGVRPLFAEAGLDLAASAKIVAQLGYKLDL